MGQKHIAFADQEHYLLRSLQLVLKTISSIYLFVGRRSGQNVTCEEGAVARTITNMEGDGLARYLPTKGLRLLASLRMEGCLLCRCHVGEGQNTIGRKPPCGGEGGRRKGRFGEDRFERERDVRGKREKEEEWGRMR